MVFLILLRPGGVENQAFRRPIDTEFPLHPYRCVLDRMTWAECVPRGPRQRYWSGLRRTGWRALPTALCAKEFLPARVALTGLR